MNDCKNCGTGRVVPADEIEESTGGAGYLERRYSGATESCECSAADGNEGGAS